MSIETYRDDCPGCQPAMVGLDGVVVPDDDPRMVDVLKVWALATRKERRAFHRVTCKNSRKASDVRICHGLIARFQAAWAAGPEPLN